MSDNTVQIKENSKLVASLREAIAIVQMIFFKELKEVLLKAHGNSDPQFISMLCGAITNEIYGTRNSEERFETFRKENYALIEQQLIGIKNDLPSMLKVLTDSLRVQMLCDSQEGIDSAKTLLQADKLGYLMADREVPLPSTFMAIVRTLGEQHGLIIPPAQITPEQDQALIN